MKPHTFFRLYANVPLAKRGIPINVAKYGLLTLNTIYEQVSQLEEAMRPFKIAERKLLDAASEILIEK